MGQKTFPQYDAEAEAEIASLLAAFTVVGLQARPDGTRERREVAAPEVRLEDARRAAERAQASFDADGAPVRVYVFDAAGVAVHAAGSLVRHRHQQRRKK